jgi:NAD(P)H-dependent FMN reductase
MNILAISGSLRAASLNTALVRAAGALAPKGTAYTLYTGMGDLPHFCPEWDTDNPPTAVADLRAQLAWADAVLICTPEYAHGMPGSLKNLLDWTVSTGDFDAKPVAALSASPSVDGGAYAHAWLVQILQVLGATLPPDASLRVPLVRSKVDATTGAITDAATAAAIRAALSALGRGFRL